MVGRKRTKAGTIQCVWSGRVNLDITKFPDWLGKFKPARQPFRPADPIGLHEAHFFRPARQPVKLTQQIIGEIRNFQKPLGQGALLDGRTRPPALAVNHLFVCQNGVINRIPIDNAFAPVNKAGLQKIKKHGLFVAVIGRVAGRKFARPIK